jgi:D-aminopeptidase
MHGRGVHVPALGTARLLKALEQAGWRRGVDQTNRPFAD